MQTRYALAFVGGMFITGFASGIKHELELEAQKKRTEEESDRWYRLGHSHGELAGFERGRTYCITPH